MFVTFDRTVHFHYCRFCDVGTRKASGYEQTDRS